MAETPSEQRGAELVQELRAMIAASYLSGDREMTAEKRHAAAVVRAAVNDALEKAAALIEQAPVPLNAADLAAAVRALRETPGGEPTP